MTGMPSPSTHRHYFRA